MRDDLGRREAAEPAAGCEVSAFREPEQKACRVEVARARRIDKFGNRHSRHRYGTPALENNRALLAPSNGGDGAFRTYRRAGFLEGRAGIKRKQLLLIGKDDIDPVADESAEAVAMPVHAKR